MLLRTSLAAVVVGPLLTTLAYSEYPSFGWVVFDFLAFLEVAYYHLPFSSLEGFPDVIVVLLASGPSGPSALYVCLVA